MMNVFVKALGGLVIASVSIANAWGTDTIMAGKIKGIQLEKHEFVLTETSGKDYTIKLSNNVVINRGGASGQGELKVNDVVCAYCDKNVLLLTANYILVQDGESKNWTLGHGDVQSYDAEKKEIAYTDDQGRTWRYSTVDVKVYINKAESKIENIKVGEHVLALLQKAGDRTTLKSLYVHRQ